jgi:hypothetical protein
MWTQTAGWLAKVLGRTQAGLARQERELRGMSGRELNDLGIGAGEIPHVLKYRAGRESKAGTVAGK